MFAHDVAVKCAIALLFDFKNKHMQKAQIYNDACVVKRVQFFEYALYMFCVACMICACDVDVTFAIALLFMSRNSYSNMDCVCVV